MFIDNVIFHFYKGGGVTPLTGPPNLDGFSSIIVNKKMVFFNEGFPYPHLSLISSSKYESNAKSCLVFCCCGIISEVKSSDKESTGHSAHLNISVGFTGGSK